MWKKHRNSLDTPLHNTGNKDAAQIAHYSRWHGEWAKRQSADDRKDADDEDTLALSPQS